MRIIVDRSKCIGSGICETISSGIFEIEDNGDCLLADDLDAGVLAEVEEAVGECPTAALRLAR